MQSLTDYEMKVVTDADWLLTKNIIINKVYEMFGSLAEAYKNEIEQSALNIIAGNAKISRGENYKGLPYVMLDYPRNFTRDKVFAIRTFFWWGNFFSISIHLSGEYLQQFAEGIENAFSKQLFAGWHVADTLEWEHYFDDDNYKPLQQEAVYKLSELPFIRLAKKIPLQEWDEVSDIFIESFRLILSALHQAPMR